MIRNSIKRSQISSDLITDQESNDALTGTPKADTVEVTVEITPPVMSYAEQQTAFNDHNLASIATTTSVDLPGGQMTLGFNQSDFPPRMSVSLASPQQRKMSEFSQDSLLNPNGFTRMTASSPGANSSRLFKKIEEMMDLSSPYNHYRCLSSESNLVQCGNSMLGLGSTLQNLATLGGNLSVSAHAATSTYNSLQIQDPHTVDGKFNRTQQLSNIGESGSRPGSGRLLRRQFSLDKDDINNKSSPGAALSNNLGNSACLHTAAVVCTDKSLAESGMPVDSYQKHSSLPSISGQISIHHNSNKTNRTPLFKHNSSSMSQDLGKIEEIPGSPNNASPPHRKNHITMGLNSQSSLNNSIPFIDGSSCSSSVSTIASSMAATSGAQKLLERDSKISQECDSEGGEKRA